MTTRLEISGDFDSRAQIGTIDVGALTTMAMTGSGPCPAGQKGGDVALPDGRVAPRLNGSKDRQGAATVLFPG